LELISTLTEIEVFLVHTLVCRPLNGFIATPFLATAVFRFHLLIWIAANGLDCVFNMGSWMGSAGINVNWVSYTERKGYDK